VAVGQGWPVGVPCALSVVPPPEEPQAVAPSVTASPAAASARLARRLTN
jgi:hypothetical protein